MSHITASPDRTAGPAVTRADVERDITVREKAWASLCRAIHAGESVDHRAKLRKAYEIRCECLRHTLDKYEDQLRGWR